MRILALLPSGTAASLQRHLHAEHCVHVMRRADVDLVVLDPELIDDARAAVSMREMLESWGGAVIVYTSLTHRALHATFRMLGHTSLALVLHGYDDYSDRIVALMRPPEPDPSRSARASLGASCDPA